MNNPHKLLSLITARDIDKNFGATITQALELTFGNKASSTEYIAAGIICTLFLSAILEGFPTMKLHTFVRNYCEENPLFTFDCKSYDKITSNMPSRRILLIDKQLSYKEKEVKREDILESFDFFTNR